jgi:RimJ/RimL family protein N-acetyltransferase
MPAEGIVALGAFESDDLVGVANYAELTRPGECEIAVVVAHEQHERGVGTALLKALGDIAREAGQHRFVADVLFENFAMRRVLHDAGWPTIQHRDGPVLSVEIDIDAIEASTLQRK